MTWMNSRMGAAGHPVWIGGFNLLPYRQREARCARRRCLFEWLGAAFVGCAAVLAAAGWQSFERARLDAQRASGENELTRLAGPLAEHARLEHDLDERSKRAARAITLSAPLGHLLDLLDTLSQMSADDVVLQQLRQRAHETELLATSRDPLASTVWLKELSYVRGVKSAEVADLHPVQHAGHIGRVGRDAVADSAAGVEFAARLRWDEPVKNAEHPAAPTNGRLRDANQTRGVR
jgi:Tfp pilus assembly protein PilN